MVEAGSATFPQKLHDLISDENNKNIIIWVNGGAAFKIINVQGFENDIVPKYFRRKFFFLSKIYYIFTNHIFIYICIYFCRN